MEDNTVVDTSADLFPATARDVATSGAGGANDVGRGERPAVMRWIPLVVPLMAVVVACVAYTVGWGVLERQSDRTADPAGTGIHPTILRV